MIEHEGEAQTDVVVPQSIDRLFSVLQRSLTLDRPGLSVEESVSPQEFEWLAQDVLQECMQLDEDQERAFARVLAEKTHISPHYLEASVTRLGDYLSGLTRLLVVHPATILEVNERKEVLSDAHHYHKTITGAYEVMQPNYNASKANGTFVRRVVGAVAIYMEQLEIPHFLQEEFVGDTASNLLIGVTALRGAQYISWAQHRRLVGRISAAKEAALAGKPADVLFVPAKWSNNL